MNPTPGQAVEELNRLTSLFEHAREHARHDGSVLSDRLDTAAGIIDWLAPVVAAARGGPYHRALVDAALRAKASHDALSEVIRGELGRLSREISQLGAGAAATASYGRGPAPGARRQLDRVG